MEANYASGVYHLWYIEFNIDYLCRLLKLIRDYLVELSVSVLCIYLCICLFTQNMATGADVRDILELAGGDDAGPISKKDFINSDKVKSSKSH